MGCPAAPEFLAKASHALLPKIAAVAIHSFQFWSPPEQGLAEVRRVLRPGGRLILLLRDHDRHAPHWLPNPVSRSGREVELTLTLPAGEGFYDVARAGDANGSQAIVAIARGS